MISALSLMSLLLAAAGPSHAAPHPTTKPAAKAKAKTGTKPAARPAPTAMMMPVPPQPVAPVIVAEDDAELTAAIAQARAALPTFEERLAAPAADETRFMVRVNLAQAEGAAAASADEFVWLSDLKREAGQLSGTLGIAPENSGFHQGQRLPVDASKILDWAYFKGKVMQGGYTNRVLIARLPADQAATARARLGW